MQRCLTLAEFLPCVGQPFHMDYPDHADTLTLVEAVPATIQIPGFPPGFLLRFIGADTRTVLSQHSYLLQHRTLGPLRILITPVGRQADGAFVYEAAFG